MDKNRKRKAKQTLLDNIDEWSNEAKKIQDKVDAAATELENLADSGSDDGSEESSENTEDGRNPADETEQQNDNPDEENKETSEVEKSLSDDILKALGDDPIEEEVAEVKLHSSIAKRWKHWFSKGVNETEREKLTKKYLRQYFFWPHFEKFNNPLT